MIRQGRVPFGVGGEQFLGEETNISHSGVQGGAGMAFAENQPIPLRVLGIFGVDV